MNKIITGKKSLVAVSIAIIVLSLLLTGGAIALIVYGAGLTATNLATGIILIVLGALLTILFLGGAVFGCVVFFTGKAVVATNGNIAEDQSLKGTVNMVKCSNCGNAVTEGEKFCGKCGKSLEEFKKCEKCETLNKQDSQVCTACGEKLK